MEGTKRRRAIRKQNKDKDIKYIYIYMQQTFTEFIKERTTGVIFSGM